MKFKLETKIPAFTQKISHQDQVIFFGSCFSDDISSRFKNAGFDVLSNPFGTIFHPIPMARNIINSFNQGSELSIFESENHFSSWDCSTLINSESKDVLEQEIRKIQATFLEYIEKSSYLFITFGTSFGYLNIENEQIVSNCHKQNSTLFRKKLSEIEEMSHLWKSALEVIFEKNPQIKIVFTVSPVRHSKDGLTENNRSKARLFELISNLEKHFKNKNALHYFPSYEIIIDELRDYRFYKEDLIHPSEQAINYIWEKIKTTFFSEKTIKLIDEVENLRKLEQHKILTKNQVEIDKFNELKKLKIKKFLEENNTVKF